MSTFNLNSTIIHNISFELQEDNRLLVIFDANRPDLCYQMRRIDGHYLCICCRNHHHLTVKAEILRNENGEEYVKLNQLHACQPLTYIPFNL